MATEIIQVASAESIPTIADGTNIVSGDIKIYVLPDGNYQEHIYGVTIKSRASKKWLRQRRADINANINSLQDDRAIINAMIAAIDPD